LPTEAEWEYAALSLIGNVVSEKDERISDRRLYPWNGNTVRYQKRNKYQGEILANFKRGRGDYMGMAGKLNDKAHITAPVRSFMPKNTETLRPDQPSNTELLSAKRRFN